MENVVINISHPVRESFDIHEAIFRGKIINGYRMDHMRYERKILRRNTDELWKINVFDTFDLRSLFNLPFFSQEEIRRAHGLELMWDVFEDDFKAAVGEIVPNFAQEEDDEDEGEEEEENVNLIKIKINSVGTMVRKESQYATITLIETLCANLNKRLSPGYIYDIERKLTRCYSKNLTWRAIGNLYNNYLIRESNITLRTRRRLRLIHKCMRTRFQIFEKECSGFILMCYGDWLNGAHVFSKFFSEDVEIWFEIHG
ncbi:hypothetical protein PUN28_008180 [Cardiocondyla obscurior]|uniref:Uncharacterized protein n=1 Tax=Cardiocondyla obscurior TaxID=286306 RepID=A0AAW2FYM5_9HYME